MLRSVLFLLLMLASYVEANPIRVYVGTYTRQDSKGIYTFTLNTETGATSEPKLAAELVNPSFVAIHGDSLFAVNEVSNMGDGKRGVGGVTGFQIGESGELKKLNSQVSGGAGPCHLSVDHTGKCVVVANYGGGSVACLPIDDHGMLGEASTFIQHTGSSVNERRQSGPHAHSANIDSTNKFAVVADLGLDKLLVYKLDATDAKLTANDPAFVKSEPGAGPRHFNFHPSSKFAYANNEMTSSVTAYQFDNEKGVLTPLETYSTLPEPVEGNSTAECLVHPNGKFVYVSNRGHNSIAMFSVQDDGRLKAIGHESTQGEIPRNFGITPDGKFLLAANQNSGTVVVFKINPETGKLKATGNVLEIPTPVCVRFYAP